MVGIHHPRNLLLVGCGNMGGALLATWANADTLAGTAYCVIDHQPKIQIASRHSVRLQAHHNLDTVSPNYAPDIVVFAVKPQELDAMLPAYAKRFALKPLYISIAAGKELAFYARHLGAAARVIRAMPNTPATIGCGMTVLCRNERASEKDLEEAKLLFGAAGTVANLDDESLMHAVTAISGCGPAYTFLFIDAIMQAGMQRGLDETLARTLAEQTVLGASSLASASRGESLAALRQRVASPGGATEAALNVLMKDRGGLAALLRQAVDAAVARSAELASK